MELVGEMLAENSSWMNGVKTCGSYTLYYIQTCSVQSDYNSCGELSHEAHYTHMGRQSYTWILNVYNASAIQSSTQFTLYTLTNC